MKTKLTTLFLEFFESEKASGIVLLFSAVAAILVANSPVGETFLNFWHIKLGWDVGAIHLRYDIGHWINDGLMAIFFLLIGLEIEREFYVGELSDLKNASLPIFAAIGGVLIPALIHYALNRGTSTQPGFGIPMATDIAFALGILALVGKKVPLSLKIFLTAFAIIDDLIAILVIALFYTGGLSLGYLALALGIFAILMILNRRGVHWLPIYLLLGLVMWYALLQSGIHGTIAGVLLAFAIPFAKGDETSPSYRLQHFLHKPVAFLIMPIFALANTGIVLSGDSLSSFFTRNTLGIFAGLLFGKPLGITLFSLLAVKAKWATLPQGVSVRRLIGAGFLGGIGFTMSIFITLLAFGNTTFAQNSKIAIIFGSILAGTIGYFLLSHAPDADAETGKDPA
ncbi:MAG: Na+/H+ antiporter NhaA [Anaerolineales bacterium]